MNTQNIGKIIKEARLAKKMTQNEVVGDFITRNMLSQIESGAAMPSIKTLEYLCGVLDIQLETLSAGGESGSTASGYFAVRQQYLSGNYNAVIQSDIADDHADECTALKALAYLELADKLAQSENIADNQKAVEYAKTAAELSGKGIFANKSVADRAEDTVKICAVKLSQYYASLI